MKTNNKFLVAVFFAIPVIFWTLVGLGFIKLIEHFSGFRF
jgi:hypothetical protein